KEGDRAFFFCAFLLKKNTNVQIEFEFYSICQIELHNEMKAVIFDLSTTYERVLHICANERR
ncbi:hypothetical protein, partial [Shouchella clausii]|uniref:hypothetical protein n=1 Tax=Shouchella clausii TaxID=79880 RepID=UPI001C52E10E